MKKRPTVTIEKKLNLYKERIRVLAPRNLELVAGGDDSSCSSDTCDDGTMCTRHI